MGSKGVQGYFEVFLLLATIYGVSSVHVEIEPRHAIVFPSGNISILCRTGVPISYCRITLPGFGALNLNKATRYNRDYQYFGTGLENGQCGVTLPQISDKLNGQVSCGIGTSEEPSESGNVMTLVVAKSPATPEMIVTSSLTRSNEYKEGETIRANCTIKDGRPPANISWYIGEDLIRDGLNQAQTFETSNGLYTVTQNLTRSLSWRDNERNLKCVAGHLAFGNKKNHTTKQMLVRYAPREVKMPIEQFGFVIGQTGEVVVEILANPRPTFMWLIGNINLQEGDHDLAHKYEAGQIEFMGSGKHKATLFINDVTMEDVAKEYFLKAKNSEGERSYRVVISTSSQPQVLLGVGSIIGIVMGVLVLLLIIVIIIFARATGRWCFAGGVPPPRGPGESSDTESADHHAAAEKKVRPKGKAYLAHFFKRKNDKVSADKEDVKTLPAEQDKEKEDAEVLGGDGKKDVVYAELDLQTNRGQSVVSVRPDDDKTEYAEIIHTKVDE